MYRVMGAALAAVSLTFSASAHAGAVDEVKLGLLAHNICVTSCKNADKEDSPIVDVQVNFRAPALLKWVGAPHPYVSLSPNLSGDTSFGAAGLEWRWEFVEGWAIAPSFGYALHNGKLTNPYPNGDPRASVFSRDHVLYGSRDLFRSSIGLQREFGEHWRAETYYVHYSHGQIIGHDRNQGSDQAGIRINYKFGD